MGTWDSENPPMTEVIRVTPWRIPGRAWSPEWLCGGHLDVCGFRGWLNKALKVEEWWCRIRRENLPVLSCAHPQVPSTSKKFRAAKSRADLQGQSLRTVLCQLSKISKIVEEDCSHLWCILRPLTLVLRLQNLQARCLILPVSSIWVITFWMSVTKLSGI